MDYAKYKFSAREKIVNIVLVLAIEIFIAYLFYGNINFFILFLPILIPYFKIRGRMLLNKRKRELKLQFKDAITSMADALSVGYSVENAMKESYREMYTVYGRDSYICREWKEIIKKTEVNTPIEESFYDFAARSGIDEIILFAQIFAIAKRSGGNLVDITQTVAESISQNFQVEEEINVLISQKKLEQRIMYFVPIGIVVYVSVASPGFLQIMYETILGKVIMTVCIAAYGGALYMAERTMNMEM